ncbi:MAG: M23 family metallopeptidase [Myxococcota bacterium]
MSDGEMRPGGGTGPGTAGAEEGLGDGVEPRDPLARPLPSVDMPLLRGQLRAARARRQAVLGTLATVGLVAAVVLLVRALMPLFSGDDAPTLAAGAPESDAGEAEPAVPGFEDDELGAIDDEALLAMAAQTGGADVSEGEAPGPDAPVPDATGPVPAASDDAPVTPGAVARFEGTFGQALGFRPALLSAGLTEMECVAIERAVQDELDFRRCRPEDAILHERDAEGELLRFEYHDEPTSYVVVTRGERLGELLVERIERPVETNQVVRSGTVRTSLGDAVAGAGLGRDVVGIFVEVFEGRIRFSSQARAGDRFAAVIDEERLDGRFLRWGQVRALAYAGERAGEHRAYWFQGRGQRRGDWHDPDGRSMSGGWLRVPCRYDRISSPFDPRRMHPILRRVVPHNGTDFAASTGTPVWAAADGEVTWAGPKGPNGNLVSVRHEGGYESHYAHLHRIQRGIRPGVEVEQRQLIGTVGSTGRSTGPHLHFGLKRGGRFVNPMDAINGPGRMLPARHLGTFRRQARALSAQLDARMTAPVPAATEEVGANAAPEEE